MTAYVGFPEQATPFNSCMPLFMFLTSGVPSLLKSLSLSFKTHWGEYFPDCLPCSTSSSNPQPTSDGLVLWFHYPHFICITYHYLFTQFSCYIGLFYPQNYKTVTPKHRMSSCSINRILHSKQNICTNVLTLTTQAKHALTADSQAVVWINWASLVVQW